MSGSRLGRGLEVLLKQKDADSSLFFDDSYQIIPVEFIEPNPYQPRKEFDEESLKDLANSIKNQGLLQPIVVRPHPSDNKKFQIVAGERRWRACKSIGMETINAVVLELTDEEIMLVALIENLQREDLNPIEEAEALKKAQQLLNISHEELSQRIGKSRSAVTNSLRLLRLDEEIKNALKEKKITPGQARPLLSISDKDTRLFLFDLILEKKLSARDVEEIVSFWKKNKKLPSSFSKKLLKDSKKKSKPSKEFLEFKNNIQQKLSNTLHISVKLSGDFERGKVVLNYSSERELHCILKALGLNL